MERYERLKLLSKSVRCFIPILKVCTFGFGLEKRKRYLRRLLNKPPFFFFIQSDANRNLNLKVT